MAIADKLTKLSTDITNAYEAVDDKVKKLYDLYLEGKSYQTIANIYNEEKVLGKTNWCDSTISRMITTEIYKGDYI